MGRIVDFRHPTKLECLHLRSIHLIVHRIWGWLHGRILEYKFSRLARLPFSLTSQGLISIFRLVSHLLVLQFPQICLHQLLHQEQEQLPSNECLPSRRDSATAQPSR